jgi:dolichyl-diphosphooligosaccharide--protein glycosyltransferase
MKAPESAPASEIPVADTTTPTSIITHVVTFKTSKGRIEIGLYGTEAPITVKNFVALVQKRFYDGLLFHRVAKNYLIQAGDPKTRDPQARAEWGRSGRTATGDTLPEELNPNLPSALRGYESGVVAMARGTTPGSGNSQFFICLEKARVIPYQYTIFGRVIDGMDAVRAIGSVAVDPGPFGDDDGIPREPITILSARVLPVQDTAKR